MAQAPVMPIFTDALIGDTTHLSTEQFGAYLLILIATWRNNGRALPDDDKRMAYICRMSPLKWRKKFRKTLSEFFIVNESGWHQQRLEKEWNKVSQWLSRQRTAAIASVAARRQPSLSISISNKAPLPSESESVSARARDRSAAEAAPTRTHDTETGTWQPIGSVLPHQPDAPPPPIKKNPPPRSPPYNHNGVTEHRPAYGPLRDPVEIAKSLGIRK